jgi:hypothetical protein
MIEHLVFIKFFWGTYGEPRAHPKHFHSTNGVPFLSISSDLKKIETQTITIPQYKLRLGPFRDAESRGTIQIDSV